MSKTNAKDWQNAERNAAAWMRRVGFENVLITNGGADGGIDVVANKARAQVKFHAKPIGRPAIQGFFGASQGQIDHRLFFSWCGYTTAAREAGNSLGIALFTISEDGHVGAVNYVARNLSKSLQQPERGERANYAPPDTRPPAHPETPTAGRTHPPTKTRIPSGHSTPKDFPPKKADTPTTRKKIPQEDGKVRRNRIGQETTIIYGSYPAPRVDRTTQQKFPAPQMPSRREWSSTPNADGLRASQSIKTFGPLGHSILCLATGGLTLILAAANDQSYATRAFIMLLIPFITSLSLSHVALRLVTGRVPAENRTNEWLELASQARIGTQISGLSLGIASPVALAPWPLLLWIPIGFSVLMGLGVILMWKELASAKPVSTG